VEGFDPARSFGDDASRRYDDYPRGDEAETVDFLAELAGPDGAALEFAIGTGRIAVPLTARGVRVDGIELSPDMVARMREKPGGDAIDVSIGDMSQMRLSGSYRLVYLVYNTIFNLLSQDDQVRCFENAARHLAEGGVFVIEAGVLSAWLRGTQYVDVERIANDEVVLDVNRYDPVTQILDESHVSFTSDGVRLGPISCRLASPAELDLMARIAGLRLLDRWGGWLHEPFTADSKRHVSVYGR
jgi:SAM-dependent methyltransferase